MSRPSLVVAKNSHSKVMAKLLFDYDLDARQALKVLAVVHPSWRLTIFVVGVGAVLGEGVVMM